MPEFSVIIPVYNAVHWLSRCLESILEQSYKEYEVLLVDDGSADGSIEVCRKYVKEDNRFHLICGTHQGPAAARNLGVKNAKGNYILFIDADDEVEKHYFENIRKTIGADNPDICYMTKHFVVEENQTREYAALYDLEERRVYSSSEFLRTCVAQNRGIPSSTWLMAFQREFGKENQVYMDETMEWSEDADFSYHLFSKSDTIKVCNKPAYFWHRDNGETLSNRITFERLSARMNHYIKWSDYYADIKNFSEEYDRHALYGFSEWLRDEYCTYLHMIGLVEERTIEKRLLEKLKEDRKFWEKSKKKDVRIYRRYGLCIGACYNKMNRWKGKLLSKFKKG